MLGRIVNFIIKPTDTEISRLILIVLMFNNATSMQLIYVDSLSEILAKMINVDQAAIARSQGYVIILIYTIFVNFLRWSIGYNLMKSNAKRDSIDSREMVDLTDIEASEEKVGTYLSRDATRSSIRVIPSVINTRPQTNILKLIKEAINMPFISGIFAIIMTSLPYIGSYMSSPNSVGYKVLIGKFNMII